MENIETHKDIYWNEGRINIRFEVWIFL
jgi:hypothetical protein